MAEKVKYCQEKLLVAKMREQTSGIVMRTECCPSSSLPCNMLSVEKKIADIKSSNALIVFSSSYITMEEIKLRST